MPGSTPPTSQLDWLISTTAMIVLFWSRATRDLLKSFGWGIAALHRLHAATKLPFPCRPPHSISRSHLHVELGCRLISLGCLRGISTRQCTCRCRRNPSRLSAHFSRLPARDQHPAVHMPMPAKAQPPHI